MRQLYSAGKLSLLFLLISTCLHFTSFAQVFNFSNTYTGTQAGTNSTGTGTISGTYDSVTNIITYTISFSGLSAGTTAAHFHGPAFPGTNAGVTKAHRGFPLGVTSGTLGTTMDTLTQAQEADLLAGKWYSNIHTTNFPAGEIRAQIFFTGGTFAAPTITCRTDTTASNATGQCGQSVAFTSQSTGTPSPQIQYKIGSTVITSSYMFPVGTTTVTATALNGAGMATCSFKVTVNDTSKPVINCPANITVANDSGVCGAVVHFTPTATDNCPGVVITSSPESGSLFPVGTTTVTSTATDASGNKSTCTFTVTVNDTEAPVITGVKSNPNQLWPPNHQMKDVTIDYTSKDNCVVVSCQLSVTSNESENGHGDGNTASDWKILDDHHLQLRAERSGNGNDNGHGNDDGHGNGNNKGRIYTITITCTDQYGNASHKTTTVNVAHDMRSRAKKPWLFVQVTPNPGNHRFAINIQTEKQQERMDLKITDQWGAVMETRNNLRGNQTINTGEKLKPGIYFVMLQQGDQIQVVKLLKIN